MTILGMSWQDVVVMITHIAFVTVFTDIIWRTRDEDGNRQPLGPRIVIVVFAFVLFAGITALVVTG